MHSIPNLGVYLVTPWEYIVYFGVEGLRELC